MYLIRESFRYRLIIQYRMLTTSLLYNTETNTQIEVSFISLDSKSVSLAFSSEQITDG